jgi:hypothetical protein
VSQRLMKSCYEKFKVQGSKFKVQSSKFKVQSSKFKVDGLVKSPGNQRWQPKSSGSQAELGNPLGYKA